MEIVTTWGTFRLDWIVVIFIIIAVFQPRLVPTLLDAIKEWTRK